jgi:hypothetical protein
MRANEFLSEVEQLSYNGRDAVKQPETVTITIPRELLDIGRQAQPEEVCEEEQDEEMEQHLTSTEQQDENMDIEVDKPQDELADNTAV